MQPELNKRLSVDAEDGRGQQCSIVVRPSKHHAAPTHKSRAQHQNPAASESVRNEGNNTLHQALQDFESKLDQDERSRLQALKSVPDASSVLAFTSRLDRENTAKGSRCVASRLYTFLESVQQFSEVVSTFVSSHPTVAALVWGSVRFVLLVSLLYPGLT